MHTASLINRPSAAPSSHAAQLQGRAPQPRPPTLAAACRQPSLRPRAPAAVRALVQPALGGSGGSRAPERDVQAEATLQAERPVAHVDSAAPRPHVGPPAHVQATGRIVASGWRAQGGG